MRFVSPEPVEVARLPWLDELAVQNGLFQRMLPRVDLTLRDLETAWLPCYDYLREAALRIGEIVVEHGLKPESTNVDIRSGMYDPRVGGLSLGYHFDVHPDLENPVPAGALLVATERAGEAVTGEVETKESPVTESESEEDLILLQAAAPRGEMNLFDISKARIVPLEPSVLYYLPRLCLHRSPTEFGPYGRNLFRYKDDRTT